VLNGAARYVDNVAPETGVANPVHALAELPEYHWKVFPPEPPAGFEFRVTDCPVSKEGDAGVGGPAESGDAPSTATASSPQATDPVHVGEEVKVPVDVAP